MDGVLGIFQSILGTDNDYLDIYLNALEDQQSFLLKATVGTDVVVQHISSSLSKPKTYREALVLLNAYLKQVPYEVLEQKATLWTTLTLKAFNSKELDGIAHLVYSALAALATNALRVPEVSKSFAHNHLGKIYESLVKISPAAYVPALICIETCLRLYPGPSGPSRGHVDKFLAKFIDTPNETLNVWCGKCLHLLQQVRGGGVQGLSHKAAWSAYQQKLIVAAHAVLDQAFANCTELYDKPLEQPESDMPALKLSNEPATRAAQLYIRFRNVLNYLMLAISQPFPVAKPLAPKKLLNLIGRGLSVTCPQLQRNAISDNLALGALLPKMHLQLLSLLESLMLVLQSNLKPHNLTILGLLVDTLQWTCSKKATGSQKPLNTLRSKAYDVLALWCTTMQHGSRVELYAECIIEQALFDIQPFQTECTLQVLSGAKKHMSKKARRQLHKAQNEQSNLAQSHAHDSNVKRDNYSDAGNQTLCVAALRCLQKVLTAASCLLKPTQIKLLQIKIIQISGVLYAMPLLSQQLYHHAQCRIELYKLQHIFIVQSHHLCPPPAQMTLHILQTALVCDANAAVRRQCQQSLLHLEQIIHPQKETLLFPVDARDIRNTFIKHGQERLLHVAALNVAGTSNDAAADSESESESELSGMHAAADAADNAPAVDLTLDEADAVLDIVDTSSSSSSSTDSVQIVECATSPVAEAVVHEQLHSLRQQSKSPDFVLRVDEDEEESMQEVEQVAESSDAALAAPAAKKQKLSVSEAVAVDTDMSDGNVVKKIADAEETNQEVVHAETETMIVEPVDEAVAETSSATDAIATEEDMLAEISATFVDELN